MVRGIAVIALFVALFLAGPAGAEAERAVPIAGQVNPDGVVLLIIALILYSAEFMIISHGILGIGGVIAMVFGALLLFESPAPSAQISGWVIGAAVLAAALFLPIAAVKAVQAHRNRPVSGKEGMIGETGTAESDLTPEGKVFVRGEYWAAVSDEPVSRGEKVAVLEVEGLVLKVKKAVKGE